MSETEQLQNDSQEEDNDECPICLENLPIETWRGDERSRSLCCGKLICKNCIPILQGKTEEASRYIRDTLARGGDNFDPDRFLECHSLIKNQTCPMCRTKLPKTNDEIFRLVQKNIQEHPDWAWPYYKMGKYYEIGRGCTKDLRRAFEYYTKGAQLGNTMAQHELGNCYLLGHGVRKSETDAMHWFRKASDKGYALSHFSLGQILSDQRKFEEAARLFALGAEQGDDASQCSLAYCYEHGEGVPEASLEKSLYWNKKSADGGNATAMGNYASNLLHMAARECQGRVDVVGKSPVPEALYWARKAILAGNMDARSLVAQLEKLASEICGNCEQVDNAERFSLCSQCKATYYCSKECQTAHWKKGHKWDCVNKDGIKKSRPST